MRIILAAKETDLRLAVQLMLSEEPGVRVIGSVSNTGGLLALVESDPPDLVLLDFDLPGQPMGEVLSQIKACEPPPVVVLMGSEGSLSDEALGVGVDHYIQKGDPPETLVEAFRRVVLIQDEPEDRTQIQEEKTQS
jgi:DNA-binding NarL/FixJ family response regulator